jgi:hypothetical protein
VVNSYYFFLVPMLYMCQTNFWVQFINSDVNHSVFSCMNSSLIIAVLLHAAFDISYFHIIFVLF